MVEYDDLMKFEYLEYEKSVKTSNSSSTGESGISLNDSVSDERASDDIEVSPMTRLYYKVEIHH